MKSLKKITVIIIALFILISCSSTVQEQNINEIPMYGGKPKSPELLKADQEFIGRVIKESGSREAAFRASITQGFQHLNKGDWRTAMKRFNQAWLLSPDRAEVHWGFGAAISHQGKFEESVKYFAKACELDSRNGRLLNDFGFMYQFWATKGAKSEDEKIKHLDKSIELFKQAIELQPNFDHIYANWAMSLYYKQDYKGAWEKLKGAEKLGGQSIDQRFVKELTEKMPRP